MDAQNLVPVTGTIQSVSPFPDSCGSHLVSLFTENGPIHMVVAPETYVVDSIRLRPGMRVVAFYDMMAPVPLIFPPQYRALIITAVQNNEHVTIRFFDQSLTATDNSLKLNIDSTARVMTTNGQRFTCRPSNRFLMVYYSITTRSIPPATTPTRVIVFEASL